jgi:hypothetical protein
MIAQNEPGTLLPPFCTGARGASFEEVCREGLGLRAIRGTVTFGPDACPSQLPMPPNLPHTARYMRQPGEADFILRNVLGNILGLASYNVVLR